MQVCPVYQEGREEELAPRGKLRLLRGLRDGLLPPGGELRQALGRCLLCGRCSSACPSGAGARQEMQTGRARLAGLSGADPVKRLLVEGVLARPARLERLARAGALTQAMAAALARALVPADSGLRLRLPFLEALTALPGLAARSFLSQAPAEISGPAGSPRLGLFVGCVTNHLRPELAAKAARILSRRATVVIPPQGCCGLPGLGAGLAETAASLARGFVEGFGRARVDKVVTLCGSCAWSLARQAPELVDSAEARRLGEGVLEISQVLAEWPGLERDPALADLDVAVHDPCHLGVGLGVRGEPRAMLRAAGVDMAPLARPDSCCGGGGLFSLDEPALSRAIFARRAADFAASGASALATSCSGCFIQWQRGLGPGVKVAHPLELLRG
jgi:glycolate oxidase iron-sulfur subunit